MCTANIKIFHVVMRCSGIIELCPLYTGSCVLYTQHVPIMDKPCELYLTKWCSHC